jgi:hypothetical protein
MFALVKSLIRFAGKPDQLWGLVWAGSQPAGSLSIESRAFELNPTWKGSGRAYFLYRAEIDLLFPEGSSPEYLSYWWPDDHKWIVSTDIDSYSTYVAGSQALVDHLVHLDSIEAVPATLEDLYDGSSQE